MFPQDFQRSPTATAITVGLALFTDMMVYGIIIPILPQILTDMGRSKQDLGLLVASYAVGLLVFTPIFGILSDRYNARKAPMLCGLMGLAVATILFTMATNFSQLVLARFAQGISGGASWSIGLSMLADVYPTESLGKVMGTVMGANVLGQLLGPPLGGVLFQHVSAKAPFYFCSALAVLDFLMRLWVVPTPRIKNGTAARMDDEVDLAELDTLATSPEMSKSQHEPYTLRHMLLDPPLLLNNLATIAISVLYSGLEPTLVLYFRSAFDAVETTTGLLFTAIVIPNIFMSIYAGSLSDKYGRKQISSLGMILLALLTPLIALPNGKSNLFIEVVFLMAFGSATAIAITPIMPDMAEIVMMKGGDSYGQVYALFNMSYSVGMIAGPLIGTALYGVGFIWDVLVFALMIGIVGVSMLCYLRRLPSSASAQYQNLH